MRILTCALCLFLAAGCHKNGPPQEVPTESASKQAVIASRSRVRDYGDLKNYHACQAKPRRNLSEQEKCIVKLLAKNCTPQSDCLVTCESSPDGWSIGGDCYHVCFSSITGYEWSSRPKVDLGECDKFIVNQNIRTH